MKQEFLTASLLLLLGLRPAAQEDQNSRQGLTQELPSGKQEGDRVSKNQKTINQGSVYPVFDWTKGVSTIKMSGRVIDRGANARIQSKNKNPHQNNGHKNGTVDNFRLTKDINAWSEGDPRNFSDDFYPSEFAVLNNVSYFVADDGIHGAELWRSDGTAAGTYLLKDVNPGEASGLVAGNIKAVGDKLIFPGTTTGHGTEPWISDGTAEGTFELIDITNGAEGSDPKRFVSTGNTIYFVANRTQLRTTDGTPGTMQVIPINFYEGFEVAEIFHTTVVNDAVYFVVWGMTSGIFLWRSDHPAGAYFVTDLGYYMGMVDQIEPPIQFTAYNNKLLFSGNSRLMISDGTYVGTVPVKNIHDVVIRVPEYTRYFRHPLKIINNVVYIPGYSYPDGEGLYKYDDSNDEGIVLVKDLAPGSGTASISHRDLAVVNDQLYFKVTSSEGGSHDELWKSEGNEASTQLVKSFAPGESTFNYFSASGTLFFNVVNRVNGNELWQSDGTETGTALVKDIWPGSASGAPYYLTAFKGKLLFSGINEGTGKSLYISDGTGAGTMVVKDINRTSTSGSDAGGISSRNIGVLRNGVVFAANEAHYGTELYRSDGTEKGTWLVKDIVTGQESANPKEFISRDGKVYFRADNMDPSGFAGSFIYQTDGTAKGTKKIAEVKAGYFMTYDIAHNGIVYYIVRDSITLKTELWKSNDRAGGSLLLHENIAGGFVITRKNSVIFSARDEEHGAELWITDGSVSNTKMVKDIFPGSFSSDPYSFFLFDKEVYFGALGERREHKFWKTDGTAEGTVGLGPMSPLEYVILGKRLLFAAREPFAPVGRGLQLFITDGTKANTKLVKKINSQGSGPINFTNVNGTVFFSSDRVGNHIELWKTDGTEGGTLMVKGINPGPFWSTLSDFNNVNGTLYFINNHEGGWLWSSDGTTEHTRPVSNEELDKLSNLRNLVYADDKLFFGAWSHKTGTELFVADVQKKAPKTLSREALPFVKASSGFEPILYPNPADQGSSLRIPVTVKKLTIRISDISGKTIWRKNAVNTNAVSLPVETLAAGIYLVNITSGKECRILKLVKN